MKKLESYRKILAGILIAFMILFPFFSYFHVARPDGMEMIYFAKKSKLVVDLFYFNKEVILFAFALLLMAAMGIGFLVYWILAEKLPGYLLKMKKLWIALGLYFLLNVLSCIFSEYREYGVMGLSIDYEGLAAIFGYMVLFIGGFFLFRDRWGQKLLIWGVRVLSLFLTIGAVAELVWGPAFNVKTIQRFFTPERYWHLLENIYLDYNGNISLTFGNPGFFGGFCSLLLGILVASTLTGGFLGTRILDGILAGGMLFDIFISGSSGAFYAGAVTCLAEGILLFRRKLWKNYLQAIGISLAFVMILLSGAGSLAQGKNLVENVKDSVVNNQYEKDKNVFTVKKIQLNQGILSVQGQGGNFQVEVLKDGSDLTVNDFRFTDENGKEILSEQGFKDGEARLSGAYEKISLTVMGRILSLDFGYQDPVEFYVQDGLFHPDVHARDFRRGRLEERREQEVDHSPRRHLVVHRPLLVLEQVRGQGGAVVIRRRVGLRQLHGGVQAAKPLEGREFQLAPLHLLGQVPVLKEEMHRLRRFVNMHIIVGEGRVTGIAVLREGGDEVHAARPEPDDPVGHDDIGVALRHVVKPCERAAHVFPIPVGNMPGESHVEDKRVKCVYIEFHGCKISPNLAKSARFL